MSEFKISSLQELQAVASALNVVNSEVEELMENAKESHNKHLKTLRKAHKRILDIAERRDQAEIDRITARSIKTTIIQFDKKSDIEVNPMKVHESGYVSYLLQNHPELYGFVEPNSGVTLNFDQIEWYSVVAVCEKHTHLAEFVNLLDAKYKDNLGNHLKRAVLDSVVAMQNDVARNLILSNLIGHVKTLNKGTNVKSLIYKRVLEAFNRREMRNGTQINTDFKAALFDLQT